MENDPWKLNNLASSPGYKRRLDAMRAAMEKWIIETNDQGRFPESTEDLEAMKKANQEKKATRKTE